MGLAVLLDRLGAKLSGRRVVPPLPPGRAASLGPGEPPPPGKPDGEIVVVPLALFIEYRDAKGAVSARRIVCKRYELATNTLLAYCFERSANRRFLVPRIVSAACPSTGELYDLATLVAGLRAGGLDTVDERLSRLLTVLVFLMRCDRRVAPEEVDAIAAAATSYALRFEGNDAMIVAALDHAGRVAPDGDDFVRALAWISRRNDGPQLARLIRHHASEVIVADGRITSEETYYGGMVDDILGRIAAGERADG